MVPHLEDGAGSHEAVFLHSGPGGPGPGAQGASDGFHGDTDETDTLVLSLPQEAVWSAHPRYRR